jgi:hypothetical protein
MIPGSELGWFAGNEEGKLAARATHIVLGEVSLKSQETSFSRNSDRTMGFVRVVGASAEPKNSSFNT